MYSIVMLAAMSAAPDLPQDLLCPVNQSRYGGGLWSNHCFYECCGPARYGWVNCWNKGFSYYPGNGRGFCGGCATNYGHFYQPPVCGSCGQGYGGGGCSKGSGLSGLHWPIGCRPAYYTSVIGCAPHVSAPPYAYYTQHNPCSTYGHFAFDSGLIGHSNGVGYAGFGGNGNFGHFGGVPTMHPPTTADLPPFPNPEYRLPSPLGTPAVMPPVPAVPGRGPAPAIPDSLIPKAPVLPPIPAEPRKDDGKITPRTTKAEAAQPALVVVSVPEGALVTVEGVAVDGTGTERSFRSPAIEPGQAYSYVVTATLMIDGKAESETVEVIVRAGKTSRASFEHLIAKAPGGVLATSAKERR